MDEAKFTTDLKNSMERQGFWSYKIPDMPTSWITDRLKFTPEKPFDLMAFHKTDGMFCVEVKFMKKFQPFNLAWLRTSQVRNLSLIQELVFPKAEGIIALGIKVPHEHYGLYVFSLSFLKRYRLSPQMLKKWPCTLASKDKREPFKNVSAEILRQLYLCQKLLSKSK